MSADELLQKDATSTIPNGKGWDEMNFFAIHVICDDGSFPQQRKSNSIWGELQSRRQQHRARLSQFQVQFLVLVAQSSSIIWRVHCSTKQIIQFAKKTKSMLVWVQLVQLHRWFPSMHTHHAWVLLENFLSSDFWVLKNLGCYIRLQEFYDIHMLIYITTQ